MEVVMVYNQFIVTAFTPQSVVVVGIVILVEARCKMPFFQANWLLVGNLLPYHFFDTFKTFHALPRIGRVFY